jgi:hypothetical protein
MGLRLHALSDACNVVTCICQLPASAQTIHQYFSQRMLERCYMARDRHVIHAQLARRS